MNIVTLICVSIGVVCLYYDAVTLGHPSVNVDKTINNIIVSVQEGQFNR